jgi:epoxyqueuosine reductase QueG
MAWAEQNNIKMKLVPVEYIRAMPADLERFRNETELDTRQHNALHSNINNIGKIPKKTRSVLIAACSYAADAGGDNHIIAEMKAAGYTCRKGVGLPLKRIAVQSGLADYGRNNITYVLGMGSRLQLESFLTDMLCETAEWREPVMAPMCEKCTLCLDNCPTGAQRKDRFLLDSLKCKKCWTCSTCCPMNAAFL